MSVNLRQTGQDDDEQADDTEITIRPHKVGNQSCYRATCLDERILLLNKLILCSLADGHTAHVPIRALANAQLKSAQP